MQASPAHAREPVLCWFDLTLREREHFEHLSRAARSRARFRRRFGVPRLLGHGIEAMPGLPPSVPEILPTMSLGF